MYDAQRDLWHTLNYLGVQQEMASVSLAFNEGCVCAVAKLPDGSDVVRIYDKDCANWRSISPLQTDREHPAVASLNGSIFVSGGYDGDGAVDVSSVERYNTEGDNWTYVASMHETHWKHRMAALGGSLYAVGGFYAMGGGEYDDTTIDHGERYDLNRDKWYAITPMKNARGRFGLSVLDGCLYAVGAADDGRFAERYDPRVGQWALIPDMNYEKEITLSASIEGRVAVVSTDLRRATMELFDPIANRWENTTAPWENSKAFGLTWAPWSPNNIMNSDQD